MSDLALLNTAGISDPNVRNFLDRFLQVWRDKMSGPDALISKGQFADMTADVLNQALSNGVSGGAASSIPGAPDINSVINSMSDAIRSSLLYQVLEQTISPVQLETVRQRVEQVLNDSKSSIESLAGKVAQENADVQASIDTVDGRVTALDSRVTTEVANLNTGITNEATARTNADSSLTTSLNAAVSRIGAAESAIATEQTTRANADTAFTNSLNTQISRIDANEAAISSESSTRASADSSLSSSLTTLSARVDTNQADIATEQTVRSNADSSLSAQISLLTAGVAGSFDYGVAWYFDSTVEGWTASGATIADNLGWVDVTSTGADPGFVSPTGLAISGAQYPVVKARIKRLGGTGWDGTCFYSVTSAHGFSTSYMKQISAPATFGVGDIAVIEFDMSDLTAGGTDWVTHTIDQIRLDFGSASDDVISVDWVAVGRNAPGASMAALLQEQSARISADSAEASARTALAARVTTAEGNITTAAANLTTEQTARANGDTALSNSITSLTTTVNGNTAAINSEQTARINGDNALSDSITALTTTVNNNSAAISTEQTARANADSALTTQINSVSAVANAKNKTYRQTAAPTVGMIAGDVWFDSDDNNKAYRYDGSSWVATDDARIAANAAAITTEQTARADADTSLANSITAQSARVDAVESEATTETNTRSTKDSALASAINRIWGFIGGSSAVIEDGALASSTQSSAIATKWNQVVASVTDPNTGNVNSASILSETRAYANNANSTFNAIYSMRASVSANGNTVVGGWGLAATSGAGSSQGPTIAMGVLANQFFIDAPSSGYNPATEYSSNLSFPFVVLTTNTVINGKTYGPGVYLKKAVIGQATIGSAEIADASITNVKIASASIDNAKISGAIYSTNWSGPGGSGWYIGKDGGDAYFNNVYARGNIQATSITANTVYTDAIVGAAVSQVYAAVGSNPSVFVSAPAGSSSITILMYQGIGGSNGETPVTLPDMQLNLNGLSQGTFKVFAMFTIENPAGGYTIQVFNASRIAVLLSKR